MNPVLKDVVWRVATPADHDAILRLDPGGGAYDIGDYLPERLKDYLSDPQTVCSIGLLRNKVVTFTMLMLVDDGETIMGRAARSDKNYRGSGIWGVSRYYDIMAALRRFKEHDVKTFVVCSSALTPNLLAVYGNPPVPITRSYFHLEVDKGANKDLLVPTTGPSYTRAIDLQESRHFICNPRIKWKLFPNSYILIGREPFKILPSNFMRMFKHCKAVFGTFNKQFDNESLETISFGSGYYFKEKYVYQVDIYTSSSKGEEIVRHILTHIPIALTLAGGSKLIMTPFFPMRLGVEEVLNMVLQGSGSLNVQGVPAKHCLVAHPKDQYVAITRAYSKL